MQASEVCLVTLAITYVVLLESSLSLTIFHFLRGKLLFTSVNRLTAFVNKVFCHASEFEYVDPKVTCSAIEWLINHAQREDGAFFENYRVHHREMTVCETFFTVLFCLPYVLMEII